MASQSRPAGIDQDALERRIDLALSEGDRPDPAVPSPPAVAPAASAPAASAPVAPPPPPPPAVNADAPAPALSAWQRLSRRLKRLEQAVHLFLYRHHYLQERVAQLHAMVEDANSRLAGQAAIIERARAVIAEDGLEMLRRELAEMRHAHRHDTAEVRRDLAWQRAELAVLKRRLERLDDGQAPAPAPTVDTRSDLALRFGQPDPGAAHRFGPHLDQLRRRATLVPGKPLLDLGCGNGDWLGVLQAAGIEACGVDGDAVLVEACRQRGLSARVGDPLAHLSTLPDASVVAVTGFLLLERIDAERQAILIEQARRVLVPGGLVQLECLSPDNLLACMAAAQQSPPVRPLARAVTEFMLASRGFIDIDVVLSEPADAAERLQEDSEAARRLNELLYGPRTYLIAARRV